MTNFKPDWAERIQRGRTKAFAKGYEQGSKDMSAFIRDLIVTNMLNDESLTTIMDTEIMAIIIEIVEES